MQKWDYKLIKISSPDERDTEERITAGGRLGFELVAVSVQHTTHFLWFKRPLPDDT